MHMYSYMYVYKDIYVFIYHIYFFIKRRVCTRTVLVEYHSTFVYLRQQSIRDNNRLLDAFMEGALCVCKNHERWATDVYSICIAVFEIKNIYLEDHFKIRQKTNFCNWVLIRRCDFESVVLGLIDAVL